MNDIKFYKTCVDNIIYEGVFGKNTSHTFDTHFHNNVIVGLILNGQEDILLNNHCHSFKNDEIFIINKNIPHKCILKNCSYKTITLKTNQEYDFSILKIHDKNIIKLFKNDANLANTAHAIRLILNKICKKPFKSSIAKKINEIKKHILDNFDTKISIQELSKKFKMNKFYMIKHFKNNVGMTPLNFQTYVRITKSVNLLIKQQNISKTALDCGFYDQSHYSKNFKKIIGVTPLNFLKNFNHGKQI
ncbi:MAG: Bifunctional transcriptional activator/DNA repair enzyme Ada [Alphaproteobacteria bacterium ADurb.Bin438]|nr:MAG: Bifunctional transcriptional activator/DNA repair enzyme Ada [Alphaproteobacteria bacterium ADurb.Bin438]